MDQSAEDRAESAREEDTRERANELYWHSDDSVSRIADELDVSKGSLYNLIDPLPAGLPCPRCSAEMEYPNRTARDQGFLTCPGCDLEEDEELVREEWREAARRTGDGTVVVRPGSGDGARRVWGDSVEISRKRLVVGAALLGAAAGLALALWARRT
ncbi:MAG: hypothetical protein PVI57_20090 [Gemmatimonadota bacterium]|jgi:hypothetical protein